MDNFHTEGNAAPPQKDTLLGCLVYLSKYYRRTSSAHALISGLPLDENYHLTINTFIRAALRISLSAKLMTLPLKKIDNSYLPMVLLLKDQRASILTELNEEDQKAVIIQPEKGEEHHTVFLNELNVAYSGKSLLISPTHRFDERTEEEGGPKPQAWFWSVMKRAWAAYSDIIVASFLINIFALASPLFIMNVYDRVVPNQATTTLWVLASGVLIVFLFDFLMRNLRAYFIDSAGRNIDIQLSKNIFTHILDLQMGTRPSSIGTLANTVQTFEQFREFVTSTTVSVLVDVPFIIIFLLIIAILGGWLVLVPIIAIPFVLLFGIAVQRPLDNMVRKSHRYSSERHAVLVEALSTMEAIKGMNVEGFVQSRWENVVEAATTLSVKLRTLANLGINFSLFAQQIAVIALVIAGVFLIVEGKITVGALIACTILTSRALVPVSQIAGLIARYQQCKTAILALDRVMQLPTERRVESNFLYLGKLEGEIEFRNVSFKYPDQPVSALNKISFLIKPHEKVGILGATGSGKSTIIKLIMKFYDPTTGNILIDGYEQHQLDPAELRHFIGYVPQDVMLFHGTIKENMTYGAPPVDDSAIIRAAKLSTVDTFVAQHPEGFNRPVGERGQYLSGGQRQAVIIARSLLLNPSVLLFDELGNSMDDRTMALLVERLKEDIATKTLVLVTHKANLLELVDRLIVLDKGMIVADGPKADVIKRLSEKKVRAAYEHK